MNKMIRKLMLIMSLLPIFAFAVHPAHEAGRPMMNERRDFNQFQGYGGEGEYAPMDPGYVAPDNQANESEWNDADVESIYQQNEL